MSGKPWPLPAVTDPPLYDTAVQLVDADFSLIPIMTNGSKAPESRLLPRIIFEDTDDNRPRPSWIPFQDQLPTTEWLRQWYEQATPQPGMAVVCGAVSGGLEMIDIDDPELVDKFRDSLQSTAPDLWDLLVAVRTPRPGLHIYYRCAEVGGNQPLARGNRTTPPDTTPKLTTLIETRGEGGYALIPPSPAACHPTGRQYEYESDRTLLEVSRITPEQREMLFTVARSFNELEETSIHHTGSRHPMDAKAGEILPRRPLNRDLPGDDYEARTNWGNLLKSYGWRRVGIDGKTEHWCRPGKTTGVSASLNHNNSDRFYVFSTNAAPLEAGQSYSRFQFYAAMEHGGDFRAAASALSQQGYGRPARQNRHVPRGRSSHRGRPPRGRQWQ